MGVRLAGCLDAPHEQVPARRRQAHLAGPVYEPLPIHIGPKDRRLSRFHAKALQSLPYRGAIVQTGRRRIQREGILKISFDSGDSFSAVAIGIVMPTVPFI